MIAEIAEPGSQQLNLPGVVDGAIIPVCALRDAAFEDGLAKAVLQRRQILAQIEFGVNKTRVVVDEGMQMDTGAAPSSSGTDGNGVSRPVP